MSEPVNILVVDDDEMILEVFKDFLHRIGTYSILTARDGTEAVEILKRSKVDFCFTDLNMPGMDGVEFTKKIHEFDNTIPVVVMTGYPSMDNAITTLKRGVVDFLVKPFHIGDIEFTIRRALEQKALFVENMLLKEEIKKKEDIARLNEELSSRVADLKILNTILQKVDWVTSSSDLFDLIVRLSADITNCDEVHFHVVDQTLGRPTSIASFYREPESNWSPGLSAPTCSERADRSHAQAGTGRQAYQACSARKSNSCVVEALGKKILEGIPLLIDGSYDKTLSDANIRSLVAIPFKIRKKLFGMLVAIARNGPVCRPGTGRSMPFTEKDLYYLNFLAERATFVIENVALYENIYENLFATLYAFVEAIEARDPYTKQHSSRVTELAMSIGREMGCSDEQVDLLNFSGHLHDIGKLGIPDSILLKPGSLTEQEYEAIKKHPIIGANIVGHLGLLTAEQKIILHHHERWDGKGYPDGLKGDSIPFLSRVLAVADVHDAMASDRAYRKRLADEVVLATIRECAGTQFDGGVVEAFLALCEKGKLPHKRDAVSSDTVRNKSRLDLKVPHKL
jgi:response regulator RpfG family c-di-GMP phosphodiesterase